MMSDDILPGDIVTVNAHPYHHREGLVIDSYYDFNGRRIFKVQFDPDDYYHAWHPTVTRIRRRTTYYLPPARTTTTVERRVYW